MKRLRAPYTAAWVALILAFAGVEGAALVDARPGDTLSEHVWVALDEQPLLGVPVVAFLGWLTVHFVGPRR